MGTARTLIFCVAVALFSTVAVAQSVLEQIKRASPIQIGPPGGGVCVGPLCVNGKGHARVKSPAEILNDGLNRVPGFSLLSEADRNNIRQAVVTTGFVATVAHDPALGLIFAKVMFGDKGDETVVSVPVGNPPTTGSSWDSKAACIIQQEKNIVTVLYNEESPTNLDKIKDGDTVNVSAPSCPAYKEKSVTFIKIKKTGPATRIPNRKPPEYIWVFPGSPA